MNLSQNISLIPVIELEPYNFSKIERQSPQESYLEAPKKWIEYNKNCYKDSNLDHINPIEPLSWFFKLEDLSEIELKIIIKSLFDEAAKDFESIDEILKDPIEYSPLIAGGYLFIVNDEIKSKPGCCCGLEDILEWKDSVTLPQGHGENDLVYIDRNKSFTEIKIQEEAFLIPKEIYDKTIKDTELIIDDFIDKSGKILNELFTIQNGRFIAKSMIYKWD